MKYFSSLKMKLIYVFRINDAEHKDCLKIGEATCDDGNVIGLAPNSKPLNEAARKRINQYTQTAGIRQPGRLAFIQRQGSPCRIGAFRRKEESV